MTSWPTNSAIVLGCMVLAALPLTAQAHSSIHHATTAPHTIHTSSHTAHATTAHGTRHAALHGHTPFGHGTRQYAALRGRHSRYMHYAGISCVPFARAETGITLTGNAATWWDEAEGRYARGNAPESGSVLNFRANASMHLGHVAVVRSVTNSRQIEIDQANWWGPGGGRGVVSRDISVVDVSAHNDWTVVRVALGHSGEFGSVYPTYGFIYRRPDGSEPQAQLIMASAGTAATDISSLNPAPRDLRHHSRSRHTRVHQFAPSTAVEVAETPAETATGPLQLNAPDHSLR